MRKSIPIKADHYSGISQQSEPMAHYREGDDIPSSVVEKLANMEVPTQQQEAPVQYEQQETQMQEEGETNYYSSEEQVQEEVEKPVVQKQETNAEINYRAMRQAKKEADERSAKLQRDNEIIMRQLAEIQRRTPQEELPQQKPKREFKRTRLEDDALIEGKQYNEQAEEIAELREELDSFRRNTYHMTNEQRLRNEYSDIDRVVTAENIEMLKELHPALARTALNTQDFYDKSVTIYNMIKDKGIYKNPIETEIYMADRKKALENNAKPKPLSSIAPQTGSSPIHKANAFANGSTPSKEYVEQLRKEMAESTKFY